ncbi:hypothetical protein BU26DRAFT_555081 [Trematosphaeria pertusa]|uniref:Uncharacterized protein n=1 Tax=Trematosphaeria pertusa TaxID=390896 RepID=A0A6A6HXI4_9PLEO|nr:uncharacterized protein BU26DRAFT_555081 [Trematosphaeria pertusa]KAF2242925.1 hypothetical protein BU26DRAFT_555081 [Trematosphaeria pertusa]
MHLSRIQSCYTRNPRTPQLRAQSDLKGQRASHQPHCPRNATQPSASPLPRRHTDGARSRRCYTYNYTAQPYRTYARTRTSASYCTPSAQLGPQALNWGFSTIFRFEILSFGRVPFRGESAEWRSGSGRSMPGRKSVRRMSEGNGGCGDTDGWVRRNLPPVPRPLPQLRNPISHPQQRDPTPLGAVNGEYKVAFPPTSGPQPRTADKSETTRSYDPAHFPPLSSNKAPRGKRATHENFQ